MVSIGALLNDIVSFHYRFSLNFAYSLGNVRLVPTSRFAVSETNTIQTFSYTGVWILILAVLRFQSLKLFGIPA